MNSNYEMKKRLILALLVMGFSGLIAQVLLLRELLVTFYGNELSIGIILANWLILEAIGTFFLGKRVEQSKKKVEGYTALQLLFSLSLPFAIYLTRILKNIIGATPGEGLGLVAIFFSSFFILSLVSIPHGALFTFGCKIYSLYSKREDAIGIGRVYIYETLGTIAGGIAFTYLLIPFFHSLQIALGLALLNIILCVWLLGAGEQKFQTSSTKILTSTLLIFLLLTGFLLFGGGVDKIHHFSIKGQWKGQRIVYYENSIYGNVAVTKSAEQYSFFSDGIPVITTPTPDITFVEEFAHFSLLSHPQPEEILILSGGAGGLINEVLKHPSVKRIDYAELDPLILKVVKKYSTSLTKTELTHPKVNINYIDGRLFLKKKPRKYNIILLGFSNPSDLQINRLFTKEFFLLAKRKLKKDGILAFNLPSLPRANIYLKELKDLISCIFNTLKEVFPYIKIIPGEERNLFLASLSKKVSLINSETLRQRLAERKLETKLLIPSYIKYRFQPWWLENFSTSIKDGSKRINIDFNPTAVFYSLSYWSALFSPYMRGVFRWFEKMSLKLIFVMFSTFILLFLLICFKISKLANLSIPICITATGFTGMIFDLALIFTFQALYGYVFYWLGLLVTALMAGIAVGSFRMSLFLERIKVVFSLFLKFEVGIILFSGMLPVVFFFLRPYLEQAAFFLLQTIFLVLSFISGLLIGAQFPLANRIYLAKSANLSRTAGLLYSADLLGGWFGGIVGGVILLPVLGLLGTCMVAVMLKVTSFVIFAISYRKLEGRLI